MNFNCVYLGTTFLKSSFMHARSIFVAASGTHASRPSPAPQAGKQITAALESGVPPTDALLVQAIADRIAQVCVDIGYWILDEWVMGNG